MINKYINIIYLFYRNILIRISYHSNIRALQRGREVLRLYQGRRGAGGRLNCYTALKYKH